jgi:outer membrane receptor protein involved in Fe transport
MKHPYRSTLTRWFSLVVVLLCASTLLAGTYGKIVGKAVDKKTGEALPMVNVILEGTAIGGSTDLEGRITIISVPPGNYRARATLLGYAAQVVTNVIVRADLTTTIQFEMTESALTLGTEVIVVAERPMLNKDETSKTSIIASETFSDLPVTSFQQVVALQAGFVTDAGGELHARGGRSNEVVYLVDGVTTRDPMSGGMGTQLDKYTIQELQVLTGGFSAEYGQALSGVVNIVTKEGGARYSGRIEFESTQLNPSPYHKADALANDYMGVDAAGVHKPRVDDKGRLILDIPSAYQKQTFDGTPALFPDVDYLGQMSLILSGPVPLMPELRFFATARMENALSQLPWGYNKERETNVKFTYGFGNWKLSLADRRFWRAYKLYSHIWKYLPEGYPSREDQTSRDNLTLNYFPGTETYLTLNAVYNYRHFRLYTPGRYAIFSKNGQLLESNYVKNSGNQFSQGGDLGDYTENRIGTFIAKIDLTHQLNKFNLLKIGTELTSYDIKRLDYQQPWAGGFWAYDNTHRKPFEIAAYLQDKLEFSSFLVNAGIRLDYVDVRDKRWIDVTTPGGYKDETSKQWVATSEIDTEPFLQISPRLGIAFPITESTVFYSSYGHFFQRADYTEMYMLRDPSVNAALVGNPGIEPQRTVAFEFGVKQQLSENYSVDVGVYFKDITNLVGSTYHAVFPYAYTIYDNSNYGKVNGIDFSLHKRMSNYFSGSLTYTYSVARGNESDPSEGYNDYRGSSAILRPKRVFYLDFDRRHVVSGLLNISLPEKFGPELFGIYPFENINTNFVIQIASGLPYTPNTLEDGNQLIVEKNSGRKGGVTQVDLRLERIIRIADVRFSAFLKVTNLFDAINPQLVWTATGDPWDGGPITQNTPDRQRNPGSVDVRRRIQVGIRIDL